MSNVESHSRIATWKPPAASKWRLKNAWFSKIRKTAPKPLDTLALAQLTAATIVSNFEVSNWFQAQGAPKVMAMNHGGSHTFEFGKVKLVNAVHTSSMPDGSYGGNPVGFVVTTEDHGFYYSG